MSSTKKNYSNALVFGVFDKFHPGHEYFLTNAANNCEVLTVVVAHDSIVELIKKRVPSQPLTVRMQNVQDFNKNFLVIPGDEILGSWNVLKDNAFDMVFLGYDQHGIARELDTMNIAYTFLDSHKPEIYKTSLIQ